MMVSNLIALRIYVPYPCLQVAHNLQERQGKLLWPHKTWRADRLLLLLIK